MSRPKRSLRTVQQLTRLHCSMILCLCIACGGSPSDTPPVASGDEPAGDNKAQPTPGGALLTINVRGMGDVDPPAGRYEMGAALSLTVTAQDGWRFDHWEGHLSGGRYDHWRSEALDPVLPGQLIMDRDKMVTAVFVERSVGKGTFDLGDGVTLSVIAVPGGSFDMGSTREEQLDFTEPGLQLADESPLRRVTISPFSMGSTEVTQAQFEALMGYVPNIPEDCTGDCFEIALGDDLPVVWVGWDEAVEFCDQLAVVSGRSCRLPSEAEWEYVCRAGTDSAFVFGNDTEQLSAYAWWWDNSGWPARTENPHTVASLQPNDWGFFDMHGNAWEWVGDWWVERYDESDVNDPVGPRKGVHRRKVLRGGAYNRFGWALRSAYRLDQSPNAQFNFGFRVVCE